MRYLKAAVVMLAVIALPATSLAIGLEAAVGMWSQGPSGDVGYEPVSATDVLDLERDARYDRETRVFGRAKLDIPVFPNIYLMASPMEFEGTGRKGVDFTFGGKTFTTGVDFYSKVVLDQYDIDLYYGIPMLSTLTAGRLNVDAGIGVKVVDFSAEVRQDALGLSESKSLTVPLPVIYLGAQVKPIDALSIEAEARGMALSGNHVYDLIGRLKVRPIGPVFIAAGYRHQDVKVDEEGVVAEMTFGGPFVEAGVEF